MEPLETAAWRGSVARSPMSETVLVKLPGLGGSSLFGPARYTPRPTAPVHPVVGDPVLVTFDDRGDPWIVNWYPA